ncbi:MAG TPA: endolytic transglycosylase MltG, partial [Vicinamibacterales bacterium]|nr:endolytic transglycosylase MltG [Vicinamibacterales bacterium]
MKRLLLALVVLLLGAALSVAAWLYLSVARPYKGFTGPETFVEIPTGSSPRGMGQALAGAGVVQGPAAFRAAIWLRGAGRRLQAGEYRFDRPMTALEVVDRLTRGEVVLRPLTVPEGLTLRQMARIFEEKGFGGAGDFLE